MTYCFSIDKNTDSEYFILSLIWGCTGFDGVVEIGKAGGGFSLASLKNENRK